MVTNRIIFFATSVQPNPEEIDYWVDLSDNPYGGSIKYFNGTEWVRLAASGGTPDLNNYYTKTQINNLLNNKADVGDVDSKVDDEEVKDVIKDIQFNTSNPNGITMVMFKYDGSNKTVSIPVASTSSAGIITSKDFLDFVKQHQLQELHTEMIDTFADIRAKYQKKLIAGLNIEIDQETNVISASGDLAVQWDNITGKPDFKPVATSGDYNDLINKLKPGKDVSISEDNVISIAIDSDSLERSLATLQSNIDKEAATARAAETKLGNDIATEKNRAQSAEQTIGTNLQNEIDRSTQIDTQHTNAINKEILDRTQADTTINNNVSSLTNRVKVNEDKLTIINGNESTTGSIANAIKQAKSYTDTTVTAEQTRAEAAEQKLTSDLASEITRAKGAESANATAIANEVERATGVEETLNSNIIQLQTQKVDKVEGKGLSTNDYTTPEKNKLAAIEAEANKYVLPAATTTTLGGIIVGDRLSIDDTGKLVATYTYTLPTASNTVLGGVKIGSNITLADGGTISITKANVTSALGVDPTTKYVTLDTAQTITGQKTFYKDVIFNNTLTGIYNAGGNLIFGAGTEKIVCLLADYFGPVEVKTNSINLGNKDGYWKGVHAGRLISYTTDGTAPIQVSSTTLCTNLNADMIDGYDVAEGDKTGIYYTKFYGVGANNTDWLRLATLPLVSQNTTSAKYVIFEIVGGGNFGSNQYNYSTLVASTRDKEYVKLVKQQSNTQLSGDAVIAGYVVTSTNVEIWLGFTGTYRSSISITCKNKQLANDVLTSSFVTTKPDNFVLGEIVTLDAPDWYGVSWSETSSNPDCTRIGNMDMHRTLPIQSMMKGYKVTTKYGNLPYMLRKLEDDWSKTIGGYYGSTYDNNFSGNDTNIMVLIPEFWWIDDYSPSSKTHNLKICPHAKPGWNHHKEAFVGAYEGILTNDSFYSRKGVVPSVNVTREKLRTAARNNGNANEYKWNIYTYNEHRAICHLFLVEYATRNSQKAVNTELTPEGFRQGGLGSGCTTGTATINGAQTWSFIPTGSSDSLGSGSGEVTVTIQQTDQSGSNTSTITRKCNRYRGIENPFGHIWKHTDDIISKYSTVSDKGYRSWSICENPINFSTNLTTKYTPICIEPVVTGYKTEIVITPTCDFFAHACTNGSETTYWCDYNWDNTNTSEHCLLIGGRSDAGGGAGLFGLSSADGVGVSSANVGSRLTYLPWAE